MMQSLHDSATVLDMKVEKEMNEMNEINEIRVRSRDCQIEIVKESFILSEVIEEISLRRICCDHCMIPLLNFSLCMKIDDG